MARIWLDAEMLPAAEYAADSIGTFYANAAIEFMQQHKDDRFCFWVGFHESHSPFNFSIEYAGKYHPDDMPLPAGSPEDDRWIPQIFQNLTEADKHGIITSYYTSVEYLDKNVGLILTGLEQLGLDKKTLVLYPGDQGYLPGAPKRFEKHMMWDPAIRAPLIIQAGGRYGSGRKIDILTEFIDLAPMILDGSGIADMPNLPGKSLMPVLNGSSKSHKDIVFSEVLADNKAVVRTLDWKYIFTSGKRDLAMGYGTGYPPPGIPHRLYDLKNDPDETKNLANDPEYQVIVAKLKNEMLKIFRKTHPNSDQLPPGLTIDQALAWFCEPPEANPNLDAM